MMTQLNELLTAIGIPGIIEGKSTPSPNLNSSLRQMAQRNKIGLLHHLASGNDDRDLARKYDLLMDTLHEVSSLFDKNNIEYAVFKTIKPFKTTPSDIDILVRDDGLGNASGLLEDIGYTKLADDSYSATMSRNMIVDLQLQPSVSNLPYLDKEYLMNNRITRTINNISYHGLNDEAELTVVACHSVYKELMFTLNDYYTITIMAEKMKAADIIKTAQDTKNLDVFRMIFGICRQVTEEVFGMELKVSEVSKQLGSEILRVENMPIKFPLSLVVKLLITKATKDNLIRTNAVPAFIKSMSAKQISRLVSHLGRDTY